MAFLERLMAAWDVLRGRETEPEPDPTGRYGLRWSLYDGTLFSDALRRRPRSARNPRIYVNTRLLWKHVESTVDFYATTVYQGSLSTDGQPLPGGQPEAIPIDPQTGQESTNDALRLGIAELWNAGNWQQQMVLRPMYGACLGDCLTELVDDVEGRRVLPVTVWPGYVADLEIDSVGNVKYFALEYPVHTTPRRTNDGTTEERYTFRKELSGEDFRYYKDGKPFDYAGPGSAVVSNPYRAPGEARGFVPAIWDRHKQVWGDHGHCAFEGTIPALMEVNSFLSHGFDFQRKAFAQPVIIQGNVVRPRDGWKLSRPAVTDDPETANAAADAAAESWDVLFATGDVGIHQATVDIGKALEMLDWIKAGIDRENPEGSFYERLGQIGNLTGPGADRALGNATSRCRWARGGYDAQSKKLFQMWLALCGFRANNGDWGDPSTLSRRQQAWLPYGMESYRGGALNFSILDRGVVMPTPEEVVNLTILKESIETSWGMREVGIADEDIAETQAAKREAQDRLDAQLTGIVARTATQQQQPNGGQQGQEGSIDGGT